MSRLFHLDTQTDPSSSEETVRVTQKPSPANTITGTLRGMTETFAELTRWLESFETTDAREIIGFDLAMEICGCYDMTIRGLESCVTTGLFSECRHMKSLADIPLADNVIACCTRLCAENIAIETTDLNAITEHVRKNDGNLSEKLLSIVQRLKPVPSQNMPDTSVKLTERFQALVELVIQLTAVIVNTADELTRKTATCEQLRAEKTNLDNALSAKEEERQSQAEAHNLTSARRIRDLAEELDEQKRTIQKLTATHEKYKRTREDDRRRLVQELEKAKKETHDAKKEFILFQEDSEQDKACHKASIDDLSHKLEKLVVDNKQSLQKSESEIQTLSQERESLQASLVALTNLNGTLHRELTEKDKHISNLESALESAKAEVDHMEAKVTEMNTLAASIRALSTALDVDLRGMQPDGILPVIRDKTEASALRLGDVLKQTCVAREDARDKIAHETHDTDIVFELYESVVAAAIRSLGTEQAPMDVSESSRPRLKRKKKKACVTVKHDKQRKREPSPQPLKLKTESTSYDFTNVGSDLKTETTLSNPTTWSLCKAERKSTGFTLENCGRLKKKYIGVPSCIVRKVLRSSYTRVILVNLGSDSPLSRLYEMLTPDDQRRDTPSQTASCHCAQFASLVETYQVGVLVCWSPCGIYELYGVDYMSEGMYIIVVESSSNPGLDPSLNLVKSYYIMAGGNNMDKYTYNLVDMGSLTTDLPANRRFIHDSSKACVVGPVNVAIERHGENTDVMTVTTSDITLD